MIKLNQHYTMSVTALGSFGEGVGRADASGFALFVRGALPGDLIETRVVKLHKNYGYGELIKIIEPSPCRVTSPCGISNRCGGCALMSLDYSAELRCKTEKVAAALRRVGGFRDMSVPDTIGMSEPLRYRNKASFHVVPDGRGCAAGFFSPDSHRVVPVDDCLAQRPEAGRALNIVKGFMTSRGITAYDRGRNFREHARSGLVKHVMVRCGFVTGDVMVCVVINGRSLPHARRLAEALASEIPGLKSLCVSKNTERSSVIMGNSYEVIWGEKFITDFVEDLEFEISPLSFFQVNPTQTKILYGLALEFARLRPDGMVIDAYCGTGTIALLMARRVKKVYGIEQSTEAVEDARRNAIRNKISNAEFLEGRAERLIYECTEKYGERPAVIVLDPPRAGCGAAALSAALEAAPERIVYVSCDPATLARDLKILCQTEKYRLERIQPVDCFPKTPHVECAAVMSRVER
ncbi:MAG: 23S rRNA (uracil(1939)-C(5))-methyltransferase RlmD [Clostridiales bacterium]|jgi:23S rRNA (uracil1939-C5)-methyltransferase|nr:23S rRNA (uracil(1939)-C(5))-methyltransferase RlmD [Clostridiales bacterium]